MKRRSFLKAVSCPGHCRFVKNKNKLPQVSLLPLLPVSHSHLLDLLWKTFSPPAGRQARNIHKATFLSLWLLWLLWFLPKSEAASLMWTRTKTGISNWLDSRCRSSAAGSVKYKSLVRLSLHRPPTAGPRYAAALYLPRGGINTPQ